MAQKRPFLLTRLGRDLLRKRAPHRAREHLWLLARRQIVIHLVQKTGLFVSAFPPMFVVPSLSW